MKNLWREPLLYIVLLGAALLAAFRFVPRPAPAEPPKIIVTQNTIRNLATLFGKTWQRPPTEKELEELIRDHIREEICVREALALGLDRDDAVIRRRLRQKLEGIPEDAAGLAEPTDEQLRAWLNGHPDAYRIERRFTFSQVYLNPERHGEHLAEDAEKVMAMLRPWSSEAEIRRTSDPSLLQHRFQALPAGTVRNQFGEPFAAALEALEIGRWQGPIESDYGAHLVIVREREEGRLLLLEEVRDAVRRDWSNARRAEAREKFYQTLLQRYTVTVEKPRTAGDRPPPPDGGP